MPTHLSKAANAPAASQPPTAKAPKVRATKAQKALLKAQHDANEALIERLKSDGLDEAYCRTKLGQSTEVGRDYTSWNGHGFWFHRTFGPEAKEGAIAESEHRSGVSYEGAVLPNVSLDESCKALYWKLKCRKRRSPEEDKVWQAHAHYVKEYFFAVRRDEEVDEDEIKPGRLSETRFVRLATVLRQLELLDRCQGFACLLVPGERLPRFYGLPTIYENMAEAAGGTARMDTILAASSAALATAENKRLFAGQPDYSDWGRDRMRDILPGRMWQYMSVHLTKAEIATVGANRKNQGMIPWSTLFELLRVKCKLTVAGWPAAASGVFLKLDQDGEIQSCDDITVARGTRNLADWCSLEFSALLTAIEASKITFLPIPSGPADRVQPSQRPQRNAPGPKRKAKAQKGGRRKKARAAPQASDDGGPAGEGPALGPDASAEAPHRSSSRSPSPGDLRATIQASIQARAEAASASDAARPGPPPAPAAGEGPAPAPAPDAARPGPRQAPAAKPVLTFDEQFDRVKRVGKRISQKQKRGLQLKLNRVLAPDQRQTLAAARLTPYQLYDVCLVLVEEESLAEHDGLVELPQSIRDLVAEVAEKDHDDSSNEGDGE